MATQQFSRSHYRVPSNSYSPQFEKEKGQLSLPHHRDQNGDAKHSQQGNWERLRKFKLAQLRKQRFLHNKTGLEFGNFTKKKKQKSIGWQF